MLPDPILYVQLGRTGDVINILPVLYKRYQENFKRKCNLLVAKAYYPILEGCTYVNPVIWEGDFADLHGALDFAKSQGFKEFKISQVYAWRMSFSKRTDSFIKESWARIGAIEYWNQLPLIFDNRNYQRERELKRKFIGTKPAILVAPTGISSPFKHSRELLSLLKTELGHLYDIIDLSNILCKRFYDFLGLFDAAKCLITIDTAHMHLAPASKVPVIALITTGPSSWHRSAELRNQLVRMRYDQFLSSQMEIIQTIRNLGNSRSSQSPNFIPMEKSSSPSSERRIFHIYSDFHRTGQSLERHEFAKSTWAKEYSNSPWVPWPVPMTSLTRSSKDIADTRGVPFIKDLIKNCLLTSDIKPNDIICLTNDDICFVKGLGQWLQETSNERATYSNRWDFNQLKAHLTTEMCRSGRWCVGTDTFAFTPEWWASHEDQFPDMILGCEAWDWVLRDLIKDTGGFEVHAMTYHRIHPSFWQSGRNRWINPANKHNQRLAKEWLTARKKPLRELSNV